MANRKFIVTLREVDDDLAVAIGNAIWTTLMTVHEATAGDFRFTVDHDGPESMSDRLNDAWRESTDGIRWT